MPEINDAVQFLKELIRIPSLPGEESELARRVESEMLSLGYSDVHIDQVGNVLGRVPGRGSAPPLTFNTHLDHVDVGDQNQWPFPPYGGEVHDGSIWGRGSVDIKGPLAAQVHGVARLVGEEAPPGDVWVTAVVQEEVGGVGARHLLKTLESPIVVIGEPSRNQLRRGHRGRTEAILHLRGRSVHASAPARGINPLFYLARFLLGLERMNLESHPDLGRSSVAPTLLKTDQTSANVTPGEVWQTLDWRCIPGQDGHQVQRALYAVAQEVLEGELLFDVSIPIYPRTTWTGMDVPIPADNPPYFLEDSAPALSQASDILERALGVEPEVGIWDFATDGGHFARAGHTPIGFGPGAENLAHTVDEHLDLEQLERAVIGNAVLGRELSLATHRA